MVKKVTWGLIYALCLIALAVVASNIWVVWSTSDKVFSDYRLLPDNTVALVLGTSNKLTDGSPNPYFENRIKTADTEPRASYPRLVKFRFMKATVGGAPR